jgi:DNA-binding CsgD family transcriptional regulator
VVIESLTLHSANGLIVWHSQRGGEEFDTSKVVGSFPWDWIAATDKHKAKATFALVMLDDPQGPVRYQLDPGQFGGDWLVETHWRRVPSSDTPVLGVSSTWNAVVENLSPRERQIAKLLPGHTVKQIAKILRVSSSTVETFRGRIGLKIGVTGGQLVAWCQSHRDIL